MVDVKVAGKLILLARGVKIMAGWQSGYAAACKAVYAGSIPASASIYRTVP
tara:strand:- start:1237 stop:1389 length:153 start_codon:yes stop_codon:yes gene_type:complete